MSGDPSPPFGILDVIPWSRDIQRGSHDGKESLMERMLLSVEEFGQSVGISRSAAYNLVREGRVRTVRMTPHGAVRVPVEAVREFIQCLETASPNPVAGREGSRPARRPLQQLSISATPRRSPRVT
jgi:predicted DNA-binding transcriptional regulator AlpA